MARPSSYKPEYAEQAIYVLRDTGGMIRYVGKTNHPPKRLESHCCPNRLSQTPIAQWVRKLRSAGERPVLEVVEWTPDWEEREQFWIVKLRAEGCRLLNVAAGGLDMAHVRETETKCPAYVWAMRFCGRRKNTHLAGILRERMREARAIGTNAAQAFDAALREAVLTEASRTRIADVGP